MRTGLYAFFSLMLLSCSGNSRKSTQGIDSNTTPPVSNHKYIWQLKKKSCPSYENVISDTTELITYKDSISYFVNGNLVFSDTFNKSKDSVKWEGNKYCLYNLVKRKEDKFILLDSSDTLTYFSYYAEGCILFFFRNFSS